MLVSPPMSPDQPATLKDLEAEALGISEREPGRAAAILEGILAREPDRLTALRALARLLTRQARFDEARSYWERVALLAPKDIEPRAALENLPRLASEAETTALIADDPARAREMLEAVLKEDPDRLTALRPLARLLMRLARFEEARPYWERIAVLAPKDGEPRMALGRIHVHAARTLEALDRLGEVLRINPANDAAQRLRAKIAAKETGELTARIGTQDTAGIAARIEALEPHLAGDANFERLKTYHALLRAEDADEENAGDPFDKDAQDEALDFPGGLDAAEDAGSTLDIERRPSKESGSAQSWLEAAARAAFHGRREDLAELCKLALHAPGAGHAARAQAAALLGEAGMPDAVVSLLREAPGYEDDVEARRRVVRALFETARDREAIAEALRALARHMPCGATPLRDLPALVEIARRLRRAAWRVREADGVAACRAELRARSDNSPIAHWTLGMLASSALDMDEAAAHFAAMGAADTPKNLRIDPAAETALLHERFNRYGDAMAALGGGAVPQGEYGPLHRARSIVGFCGAGADPNFPECLIDVILEEIAGQGPVGYAPRRGHLLTVSSSLRAGGSERQTVTVAGKMAAEPCIEKVVLALRNMNEADASSFLRAAREMPVEIVHFGADWSRRSDVLASLPQLAGRERLVRAIDLLPHLHREELIRVTKLILERRPQAVHLRQDLFIAGIACRLAGVDRFLIHRGSLSPNLWGHGLLESELYLRPMRHTYRRLLEAPGFCIVNNSRAGAESDRDWTGWPDSEKFRVVHNAVEFARIERDAPAGLRTQAGISRDAFLVAGIFRIEPVKRPMLWIEAASLVAARHGHAHFVILGDGAMGAAMRDYADAAGFGARLHMPGFVSNVAEWLGTVDLILLTSEREGLPNVLIEGQHFGVPAVSSDVGGAFETFEPGITGHLVPADDGAASFADAVSSTIADEDWRRIARARAPAFAHAKFGVERTICELFAALGIRG